MWHVTRNCGIPRLPKERRSTVIKRVLLAAFVVAALLAPSAMAGAGKVMTYAYGGTGANVQKPLQVGVKAVSKVKKATKAPKKAVTVAKPVATAATLPFTGADLGLFAGAGVALIGAGLLARRATRQTD
jgi:hypothetical protein